MAMAMSDALRCAVHEKTWMRVLDSTDRTEGPGRGLWAVGRGAYVNEGGRDGRCLGPSQGKGERRGAALDDPGPLTQGLRPRPTPLSIPCLLPWILGPCPRDVALGPLDTLYSTGSRGEQNKDKARRRIPYAMSCPALPSRMPALFPSAPRPLAGVALSLILILALSACPPDPRFGCFGHDTVQPAGRRTDRWPR